MPGTVDSLDIKISAEANAASASLNNLISTLGKVASNISAISSKPLKINFTVSGGAEKEVNRLEQYVNQSAKTMSKNLQSAFNISPNNMAGVREEVNNLLSTLSQTGKANLGNLAEEILRVGRSSQEADATVKEFYSTFNSMSKIAINSVDMTTDAWRNMNGAIRRVFTSDLSSGATTLDMWIKSLNTDLRMFLESFGDVSVPGNQFQTLTAAIKHCQEQLNMPLSADSEENKRAAMMQLAEEAKKAAKEVGNVKKALEATGGTSETQNTGFSSITSVLTKLSKIDTGALTKVGTACESISAGVQSLNGVHVDVKSLEQIGNLTEKLKKIPTVNTDNIKNIGDALNTLSTSINSVSNIGSVDKSITNLVNALRRLASVDMTNFSASGLNGITEMVTKLAAVPDVSSNVNRLVSSLAKLAGTGSSITTVSQTLPTLGNALSQLITKISALGTIDASISSFTSAIAQLASSGAKATQAAANLRELGNALYEVMVQMSKAPAINSSVVQLTSAMSQLGRQHVTVGNGFTSMNSGATKSISIFGKLKNSISNVVSKSMSLYYSLYMVKRVFSALGSAIEKSMDYIETYNYYNVALSKVSEENAQYYAEYGYEDAETYANSFSERLEELTTKMTGYTLGDNGELISTGSIGLGLDPNDLMNYQANIMSITNSVGMMGETSEVAAESLSMLASDLSSLKNIDVDTVMDNLTSGLVGQSRVMYQYGIDITNATLQEYAYAYGVDKSVSSMTQSEKMQLRLIAILDQSRVSWGDQANTVNSVANQYRIFKQQASNLARTFGSLFIPILQAVLPYINAITKALTELFNKLGKFIYGDDWEASLMDGISGSSSSAADYMDELEDSTSDLADDYEDATEAAKEYENTVLGIDQLHKLNSENDSSTSSSSSSDDSSSSVDLTPALSDLLAEYQSVWDAALEDMNSKVDEFYALLTESAYSAGSFIGDSIYNALESIDWEHVYEGARNFGTNLAEFLNGLISPELFYSVGKTIANSLNTAIYASLSFATTFDWTNFGQSIASGVNGFFQNFDFSAFADSIDAWVQGIFTALVTAIKNISWKDVWNGITDFLGSLDIETIAIIIGMVAIKKILGMKLAQSALSAVKTWLASKLTTYLGTTGITVSSLKLSVGGLILAVGGITLSFSAVKDMYDVGINVGDEFKLGLGAAIAGIGIALFLAPFTGGFTAAIAAGIAGAIFGGGTLLAYCQTTLDSIKEEFKEVRENIKSTLHHIKDDTIEIVKKIPEYFIQLGEDIIHGIGKGIENAWEFVKEKFKQFKEKIVNFFKEIFGIASPSTVFAELGEYCIEGLIEGLLNLKEKIKEAWETIKGWFSDIIINIGAAIKQKWSDLKDKWEELTENVQDKVAEFKGQILQKWSDLKDKWHDITDNIKDKTATFKGQITQKWSDIKSKWTDITDNVKGETASIKAEIGSKWNDLKDDWEELIGNFKDKTVEIRASIADKASDLWEKFKSDWDSAKETIEAFVGLVKDKWNTVKEWIGNIPTLSQAIQLLKKGWSTVKGWIGNIPILNQAIQLIKNGWNTVKGWIGNVPTISAGVQLIKKGWSTLADFIGKFTAKIELTVEWKMATGTARKAISTALFSAFGKSGQWPTLKFAAGGYLGNLSSADLLVTRENGIPEMVGRIGSQTAVANNDQIAAGIAAAVQPAVYNAMMAANASRGGNGNVELVLEIDGEEIGRVATNYQKLQNKRYTVEPSFV